MDRPRLAALAIAAALALGCGSEKTAPSQAPAKAATNAPPTEGGAVKDPVLTRIADAATFDGKTITVRGEAANAKLGRIVILEDGHVYCGQDNEWDESQNGMPVTVSGLLEIEHLEAPASAEPVAAGIEGTYHRLSDCVLVP